MKKGDQVGGEANMNVEENSVREEEFGNSVEATSSRDEGYWPS